jgi:hypothetical protein
MTRKEAKDTKGDSRGFRAFSWFSCFRIPADKELYQRQIEATNRQIDGLAYEVYELTDEEKEFP